MKASEEQQALRKTVSAVGIAYQSGRRVRVTLKPAPVDFGIRLFREDLGSEFPLSLSSPPRGEGPLKAALRDGEAALHLVAALRAMNIDNVLVEVDGDELPWLDGSAAPWVHLLQSGYPRGKSWPRRYTRVPESIALMVGANRLDLAPAEGLRVTMSLRADHTFLRRQDYSVAITPETFSNDIAPARSMMFDRNFRQMRQRGLGKGANFENVVVLTDTGLVNPLRFDDEFARHEILDLVGELGLISPPLLGHVTMTRTERTTLGRIGAEVLRHLDGGIVGGVPESGDGLHTGGSGLTRIELVTVSEELLRMLQQDPRKVFALDPDAFERLICDRLDRFGYEVRRVGSVYARDGGIDIIAWSKQAPHPFLLAVQAKHRRDPKRTVGPDAVRDLVGAVSSGPFHAGMLVTSSTFTADAKWFATQQAKIVRLRDFADLSHWICGEFLDSERWREIPTRIELAPGVIVRL